MKAPGQAKATLARIHEIDSRRFLGDIAASDILIDFQAAVKKAGLTEMQKTAIALVYIDGHTHESAAEHMNVERSTITKAIKSGIQRIDEIYEYWGYLDEREEQAA